MNEKYIVMLEGSGALENIRRKLGIKPGEEFNLKLVVTEKPEEFYGTIPDRVIVRVNYLDPAPMRGARAGSPLKPADWEGVLDYKAMAAEVKKLRDEKEERMKNAKPLNISKEESDRMMAKYVADFEKKHGPGSFTRGT